MWKSDSETYQQERTCAMRLKLVKGYVLVAMAGLYFAAVAIFVLNNVGNPIGKLSVYWKIIEDKSVSLLTLVSMAAGVVGWFLLKAMVVGIKSIRMGHREGRIDELNAQAKAQAKQQKQAPVSTPADTPAE